MTSHNKKSRKRGASVMRDVPANADAYTAPGRLGGSNTELSLDRRVNGRLLQTLARYGLDRNCAPPSLATLRPDSTPEELAASMAEAQAGFEKLYEALPNSIAADAIELEVEESVEEIPGPDRRRMKLHHFRPKLRGGPLPCIVYLHDGIMTILKTMNKVHRRWCISLAAQGMVVVAVDFRNAWSHEGFQPFPAGLHDCCAAVQWIHSHKDELNVRNLVIQGDGGGANLALATAIRGSREGWSCKIDGVYACSPCISNAYGWSEDRKLTELPSLLECHGYYLNVDYQAYMAHVYTPRAEDANNPLAWPYHATSRDLKDMPPHVLEMSELDPFRDEGMAYYRKLSAAGVRCTGSVNLGHTHGASLVFRQALPEDHRAAARKVAAFAKSV